MSKLTQAQIDEALILVMQKDEARIAELEAQRDNLNRLCKFNEKTMDDLIRQRDELFEVLVNSRNALESANEMGNGPIVDTIWYGRAETLFDYMDAAIARLKESK